MDASGSIWMPHTYIHTTAYRVQIPTAYTYTCNMYEYVFIWSWWYVPRVLHENPLNSLVIPMFTVYVSLFCWWFNSYFSGLGTDVKPLCLKLSFRHVFVFFFFVVKPQFPWSYSLEVSIECPFPMINRHGIPRLRHPPVIIYGFHHS